MHSDTEQKNWWYWLPEMAAMQRISSDTLAAQAFAKVTCVVTDQPGAGVIVKAGKLGVRFVSLPPDGPLTDQTCCTYWNNALRSYFVCRLPASIPEPVVRTYHDMIIVISIRSCFRPWRKGYMVLMCTRPYLTTAKRRPVSATW